MIGMGNDDDQGYALGAPLDFHYVYLTSGWPTWNANGGYVDIASNTAKRTTPCPCSRSTPSRETAKPTRRR